MPLPPYTKPPLNVPDQLALLKTRGLHVVDDAEATHYLNHIGYYRLGGYAQFFQVGGNGADHHNFKESVTFDDVLDLYIFDRKLRILLLDAIERIENSIRAALSNYPAIAHGAHWYMNPLLFRATYNRKPFDFRRLTDSIKTDIGYCNAGRQDAYIQHYYMNYGSPDMPPCWMAFQSLSFGSISWAYSYLIDAESKKIAHSYGLNHDALSSWLHSISYIRNICAHHSLLWNRRYKIKPLIARVISNELTANTRIYAYLLIMQFMLVRIAPGNHWANKLRLLLDEHPRVSTFVMGFPKQWRSRAIWGFSSTQSG